MTTAAETTTIAVTASAARGHAKWTGKGHSKARGKGHDKRKGRGHRRDHDDDDD